jgi:hypothetical protein
MEAQRGRKTILLLEVGQENHRVYYRVTADGVPSLVCIFASEKRLGLHMQPVGKSSIRYARLPRSRKADEAAECVSITHSSGIDGMCSSLRAKCQRIVRVPACLSSRRLAIMRINGRDYWQPLRTRNTPPTSGNQGRARVRRRLRPERDAAKSMPSFLNSGPSIG